MQYLITGQKPLSGTVVISGAKNAALKLIVAALLCEGTTTIENVPRIRDIESLLEIINYLGGEAKFVGKNTVTVSNHLNKYELPLEIASKTRVSILLIAPLLHQFKKAVLPNPGGCRLGERSVDRLVSCVMQMGAEINYHSQDGFYHCQLKKEQPGKINFAKKSHTGTELAIMFASRINEKTVINNAALEPEIDDLIKLLNLSGAKIKRNQEQITVEGKPKLTSSRIKVQPDRIEAATFMVLSALFQGKITLKNAPLVNLEPFLKSFVQAGYGYKYVKDNDLLTVIVPEQSQATDIVTGPHPGFLTDWQPLWTVLMTQSTGQSTVHETVFENRLGYVKDLRRFGAKIEFFQPMVKHPEQLYQFNGYLTEKHRFQAIKISGPTPLHNGLAKMTDIRAGACLVLAALIAKGTSVISGVEQIERGYENLVDKLRLLGADIALEA